MTVSRHDQGSSSPIQTIHNVEAATSDLLRDALCSEYTLEFQFDRRPDLQSREALRDCVRNILEVVYDPEEFERDTWEDRARVLIEDGLGPHFSVATDNGHRVGVWTAPDTLLVLWLTPLEGGWLSVNHWHPDSLTSGFWSDRIGEVHPGLTCLYSYRDDDGAYYDLHRTPGSAEEVATSIVRFAEQLDLFGAERLLLPMLLRSFETEGILREVYVDMLPSTDNPGYELSACGLGLTHGVAQNLRDRGYASVDAETAAQWLERIEAYARDTDTVPRERDDLDKLIEYIERVAREQ